MKHNRYKELDALRGIAALMVVVFHNMAERLGTKFFVTGVDLFFIISGFVIYMTLTKVQTGLDFVINRISRLYPTYWVCVTFTFILILIFEKQRPLGNLLTSYIGNMTMFQHYLQINDLDPPYWTLIVEMNFYLGILLLFSRNILKYVETIGIALSIGAVITMSLFYRSFVADTILIVCPLFTFIPLFLAGIVFYKMHQGEANNQVNYLILLICLTCQILLFNYGGTSKIYINQGQYAAILIIYFSLFLLFVKGRLKFIVSKPTLFLGKISYPLYLVHQYLSLNVIRKIVKIRFPTPHWLIAMSTVIAIPLSILIAYLISRYVEIPVNRFLKEKLHSLFDRKPVPVVLKVYNENEP